jgi:spore germination cell wall hydrolase CwlJ-like protein
MTSAVLSSKPVTAHPAVRWVRRRPHEAAGSLAVGVAVLAGFAVIGGEAGSTPRVPSADERALVQTPPAQSFNPFQVRAIAPDKAVAINAAMPLATGPNPAARPFKAGSVNSLAYRRALECLAQAVYYEAARETPDGQRAVAQVVLNRVRHSAYPATVCGVVYQGSERNTGCQFSFTCDGALARTPMRGYWDRARNIAHAALQGYVHAPVGNATHYHANYVVPYWASTLTKNAVVGLHIFYRWRGGWGEPAAFAQRYSGKEGDPWALRSASLAAEARDRATPDDLPEIVVQAKQELPPELAKLVDAEVGAKGEGRVTMRIPAGKLGDAGSKDSVKGSERTPTSPNLRWTLTGQSDVADQKPFGQTEPSKPQTAETGTKPAAVGGEL